MKSLIRFIFIVIVIAASVGSIPAAAQEKFQRAPDALERVSWRTRTLVGDERLTHWPFAISTGAFQSLTFLEAIVRSNALGLSFIEASAPQKVSPQIQKNLDHNLVAGDMAAIKGWLKEAGLKVSAYRVDSFGGDADSRRKLFEFAKGLGAETIVSSAAPALFDELDKLANEFGINVALEDRKDPKSVLKALGGRSRRLGIAADTGLWMEKGIAPADALAACKDRLSYLALRDRSALGAAGRNVMLGKGAGRITELFREMNRLNLRPVTLALDTTGVANTPADLLRAVEAFEETVQPAYGAYFTALSRSRPIRRDIQPLKAGDKVLSPDEVRQKIEAAIPRQPYATPKKRRKLLVIDACIAGMSHNTIPHGNLMLELMGKISGAWETELNNDLNNLKYPKIKEYDAVFLNDNVGELLPDPEVREGLARFVREGGGLGGMHGTPWASRNWPEFAEMIGAQSAPHRIEPGIMKVYDPSSPIVRPFGGKDMDFREEYYRFQHEGPGRLIWEKVRVLLTVDLDLDPGRPWTGYKRPDNVYPVTWIRSYGRGRTFYCSLGHLPETFMTPEIVGHLFAGVQFILGDLAADTTPNGKAEAMKRQ